MSFYGIDNPNRVTPQWVYPRRGGNKPSGTCIVHTAEMYGALNTASFLSRRSDYGAYHSIVDDKTIIEYVPYEYETWQDSETNNWAVGISAACRAADWNTMAPEVREGYYRNLAWCAADFVKYMKEAYGINVPLRRISGAEARARVPGFCAHGDSGIARSDPGRDFDWAKFFKYTAEALAGTVPTQKKDDKMLIIAKQKGSHAIWIGDGVLRRHIPNPRALQDLQWLAQNGFLNIRENGKVFEFDFLDGLGTNADAALKGEFTNFYGTKLTVPGQLAHIDKNVNDHAKALKELLAALEVGKVELTAEHCAHIAEELKKTLAPGLAVDLARRLAE